MLVRPPAAASVAAAVPLSAATALGPVTSGRRRVGLGDRGGDPLLGDLAREQLLKPQHFCAKLEELHIVRRLRSRRSARLLGLRGGESVGQLRLQVFPSGRQGDLLLRRRPRPGIEAVICLDHPRRVQCGRAEHQPAAVLCGR